MHGCDGFAPVCIKDLKVKLEELLKKAKEIDVREVADDFMDKIVHNPIRFREGTPISVQELNRQSFTSNHLSDDCYFKTAGKVTKRTKKQIAKANKSRKCLFGKTSSVSLL